MIYCFVRKVLIVNSLFWVGLLLAQQEKDVHSCKLKFDIDTLGLSKTGILVLKVQNKEDRKIKVIKNFDLVNIQPMNIEKFDEIHRQFSGASVNTRADVDFLRNYGPYKTLKPDETIEYMINLANAHFVQSRLKLPNTTYRFNLRFDPIDLVKRTHNTKCYADEYTSQKIIFRTK